MRGNAWVRRLPWFYLLAVLLVVALGFCLGSGAPAVSYRSPTRYDRFITFAMPLLGLGLGAVVGILGALKKSFVFALGCLIIGVFITGAALSPLPTYYIFDEDFAVWLIWLCQYYWWVAGWFIAYVATRMPAPDRLEHF